MRMTLTGAGPLRARPANIAMHMSALNQKSFLKKSLQMS